MKRRQIQFETDQDQARELRRCLIRDAFVHSVIIAVVLTALYFAVRYGEHIDYLFK